MQRRSPVSFAHAAVIAAALALSACGSSATSTTAPSQVPRCGISLSTAQMNVPASGGSGTLTVAATRECVWSAEVDAAWLTIRAGASGQGEGTVEFAAAPNPDPRARTGGLLVNGTRAQVTQAAAECVITLPETAADFPSAGGTGRIDVRASSSLCTWTAAADAPWIELTSNPSGSGNGAVTIAVAATTGPPRAGTVTIAGQRFHVTQSQGCTYALDRDGQQVPPAGATGTVALTTGPACPWTAAANVPWITISPASGAGPAAVSFSVTPTDGPARVGTAVIAGRLFTVNQAPGCTFEVLPAAHAFGAGGGPGTISIATAAGCAWSASSTAPWIVFQGPTSGQGPASLSFTVAPTTGPARTAVLNVAGRSIAVTQSQGCSYTIAPESQSLPASGGAGTVAVSAGDGCAWTAVSNVPWATITAGASGTGSGEVRFSAAATTGPARSGTLTIAGRTFTITQGEGCSFGLAPTSADLGNAGGERTFDVQTAAGCAWTASTSTPWITITSGASGSGTGTVRFTVAANTGPNRSGSITAGGQTFTVTQGTGCTYALSPSSADVENAGGQRSFDVQSAAGCAWTASTSTPWITIDSGASGSGNGTVRFTVAANSGPGRSGSITAAGRTFTVTQGQGCTFAVSPEQFNVPASGGGRRANVVAPAGCAWTAASNVPWITIASGANGSGIGDVNYAVAANTGPARSGTLTIAGRTHTVNQEAGCTYAIAPTQASVGAAGGPVDVTVTAAGGCAWTAVSHAPWITAAPASGTGNGTVRLTVAANADAARSGTVTIAGATFTVDQSSGCTYTIAPSAQVTPAAGGTANVTVTAAAACAWTSVSNAPWIVVASGQAGSGSGAVELQIAANTGVGRTGTATIAGQTFTVTQESGCAFTVAPETITAPAAGSASQVDVTTTSGCAWTAAANDPWIAITSGASGNGSGAVAFTVAANSGPARTGSLLVAGRTVSVSQESGCTFVLTPSNQTVAAGGGTGSVAVDTNDGCAWTAVSGVSWIVVTSGASGTGDGVVQFTVEANTTGAPRAGSIAIGTQTFTVNQQ